MPGPAGTVLDVRGADRTFPDGTVSVPDLAFHLRRGEFVSVVGPSGCGRSTLRGLAAGLEVPSSGSVPVAADHVGYVVPDPTLLPRRSARRDVGEVSHTLRDVVCPAVA